MTNGQKPEAFSRNCRENALRVVEEWNNHQGKGMDGSFRTTVGGVDVVIRDIQFGEDDEGRAWIDVWTGSNQRPAFRITNPPTLVKDSRGPVVIREQHEDGTFQTTKHREDAVQAVAETVAKVRGAR